jgi:hypothetical protein
MTKEKNKEYIIIGWDQIAKFTPFSTQTVIKKYRENMMNVGIVFKSRIGRSKRPRVWAFPSQVMKYFTIVGQKNEGRV